MPTTTIIWHILHETSYDDVFPVCIHLCTVHKDEFLTTPCECGHCDQDDNYVPAPCNCRITGFCAKCVIEIEMKSKIRYGMYWQF